MRPQWPPNDCVPADFCRTEDVPSPHADDKLERMDNKTRFRVGEHAYFGCTEPDAVLETDADLNVFELECLAGGNWATTFQKCIVEPVCDSIPTPDQSSGLRLKNQGVQKVKHGDLVTFECINRDNFEEILNPESPEIHRICKDPVSNGIGTLVPPNPWPKCEQLPCRCLGKEGGLTQDEGRNNLSV